MGMKEYGKNYLKGKAKGYARKILIKTIPYWGPVLAIILIVVIVLAAVQGFMSQEKVDETISKKGNARILQDIKDKVNNSNNQNTFDEAGFTIGKMKDYYGTDKKFAMKPGIISSYLKYEDMAIGNNDKRAKTEKEKIRNVNDRIDKVLQKLKPKFVYMQSNISSSRHYKKTVREFEEKKGLPDELPANLYVMEKCSKRFKPSQYKINDKIYIFNENKTYTVKADNSSTKKKFDSTSRRPKELKAIKIYDEEPDKFDADNYDVGSKIYIIDENKTYTIKSANKVEIKESNSNHYFLTYAKTYQGEFQISYKTKTTKYKNKKNEVIEETKPVIKKFKQVGKMYDPLRNVLKADNPKEDLNEAVAFITGVGEGYDNASDDMDWTFTDVDVMTYTGGGTFAGKGEKFNGSSKEFIEKVAPSAIDTYRKYQVFPSITIAQSILESGWGSSGLTRKANNLFGIKVSNSWKGPCVEMLTREYSKRRGYYYVIAKFRAYDSWKDSIEDHGKFLKVDNTRYADHGMFKAKDYTGQAYALKNAGYATSPTYAQNLINNFIIPYGLYQYDGVDN
ncbi:glycoside hydrolase family 73 protein [Clostridium oryzae]|uniref:Exo-glucosaminidase LytG n=1 Tax=Clostridium oryzae TaxID=1450648 RepID=A0A1V4IJU7_9CLOT|nr:glycoside hydrolase family 73 protein [Clostridium oryzae]OPJ59777.1 Exo-glucosaminidase LytG precursor [Clostridium oryzae]